MPRHRYLVAYDIRDEHRLPRVAKIVERYGDRIQFSVFCCELSKADLADLRVELQQVIDTGQDRVLFVDLGRPESTVPINILGQQRPWPRSGPHVV
ncbi:CRISPR-associated endonuclease Cas2 [Saccharopolyspora sp. HNM0986]|uniref:CRISPR-associated endonuclease Cas2 n=1 Tax=Saccharopolyspora galaxeae TaxID=2781241 RepID=UPI00190E1569|nr:CRISPR-associated endonuclease Cas2 [Saccharopolyspora sp. HNM0986]MBK0869640.1 CRISPR-associated endonuclease Cas2 [Saccharopolyspora sp. HNM0986]